jgi:lipopolysaccharide export system protein LptA
MKPSLLPLLALLLLAARPASAAEPEAPPTVITSQNLEMQSTDEESTFLFTGLVTVTGNNMKLTCDRLEAVTVRTQKDILHDKDKSALGQVGKFKRMLATSRVRIEQGTRVATCGRAEVLPTEERIILTEDPMVRDGESVAVGERMFLNRGERRVIIEKARIILPTIKDLGFPKGTPAPAPTPAANPAASPTPAAAPAPVPAPAAAAPAKSAPSVVPAITPAKSTP